LTDDVAIQVSDRRYSFVTRDGKIVRREDDHNKAILLCGRIAIGFTGLGELNGMHTDDWILTVLRDARCKTSSCAASIIQMRITEAFRRAPQDKYFGEHTIIGVGWEPDTGFPILFHVSNSENKYGQPKPLTPGSFSIYRHIFRGQNSFSLSLAGDIPSQERIDEVRAAIRNTCARQRRPEVFADLLVKFLWARANESETVGRRLMVVSLPRQSVSPGWIIVNSPPSIREPSFLYVGPRLGNVVQFGPHFVCGGTAIKNFKVSLPK